MPEAFINLLAMLGWNDGTDKEIFTMEELIASFSVERISKAGAKFDFEKAKWYNHEWIKTAPAEKVRPQVEALFVANDIPVPADTAALESVIDLVKDRCQLLTDFITQSAYFFVSPREYDLDAVKPKWTPEKAAFFMAFIPELDPALSAAELEAQFKALAQQFNLKPGELMLPFRVMLVGGKFGPGVFDIAIRLGVTETTKRIMNALSTFN